MGGGGEFSLSYLLNDERTGPINDCIDRLTSMLKNEVVDMIMAGLGSSTVDQVLKYTKYPKYIPSTSTGQVLIFFKST